MNYFELSFKEKALQDFKLDVYQYIDEIDDIKLIYEDVKKSYSSCLIKDEYKKCIKKLNEQKSKINIMCNKPESLTFEDRVQIHKINEYFKHNTGYLSGFHPIRKKYTESIVKQYKEIALANRMFMIVNKDEVFKYIDKLIDSFKKKYDEKRSEYDEMRKLSIKNWQIQYYDCSCGELIQKVCRSKHEKSIKHKKWLKEQNPELDIEIKNTLFNNKKYKCDCGKEVTKSNKFTHDKTKYHITYCKPCNETTPENIVLTMTEIE